MINNIPVKKGGRRSYSKFSVINPGKGLNNFVSDNLIDDKESSDLENVQFSEGGVITKADGYESVGTGLTNNPRGLGFYTDTSSSRRLLTVDGTDLKYLNGTTWTSIAGAVFSSSTQINMTQAMGKMYICDGTNAMAQLDTLTLTRPTTTPSAKFSIYYGGYHIAAGTSTNPNRLYISVTTDPSDFTNAAGELSTAGGVPGASVFAGTGANYVDVNKDDGDKITGLAKFQDVLIIFKEKSIFQLTFDSTGTPVIAAVTKNYGAVSHRAIDNVDNDVFFLSRNGLYVLGNEPNYFNVIRTNELSARIHPIVETINQTAYEASTALFTTYVFYLGIPTGSSTGNDTVITYDRRYQAFSRLTYLDPEAFCLFTNSSNQEGLYFTSNTEAKVFKFTPGTYSADGDAISSSWTSKAFDLQDFSIFKQWIDVTILFRQLQGQVSIELITDNGTIAKTTNTGSLGLSNNGIGSFMWGEELFGGSVLSSSTSTSSNTNNVPYRIRIAAKSRSIKIRISNNRPAESMSILGFSFTYRNYSHFSWPSVLRIQ
jgi:hypothetical protein